MAVLACVFLFLIRYLIALHNRPLDLSWVREEREPLLRFAGKCHPMEKKDRLPILLITALYALTAFFQLGDMTAPQDFVDFKDLSTVTVEISSLKNADSAVYSTGIRYYPGLGTGSYNIEISSDGEHWSTLWQRHEDKSNKDKITGYYWANAEGYSPSYALTQNYNQLFKWIDIEVENPQNVRYLRITGKTSKEVLELGRLCLLGKNDQVVPLRCKVVEAGGCDSALLLSLFDTEGVPEKSTWHNSTYFDEIYHARTAKEHVDGIYPYEVTHPPLGKLIIGLGIRLFGMTPFGWRFSGTLLGVLMLPILYIFLKNMFGKTVVASCGTILFATEFMHLTQTRISTIDTYAVFFILGMYFFMYRYLTLPAGTPFSKGALPLFLSGLMWGLGAASKWTVFYAGIGLAVLYFIGLYQKLRDWPAECEAPKGAWVTATLLFSVLCFVLIPFAIYCAAYLPYARALGVEVFAHSDQNGLILLLQNVWGKFTGGEDFVAQTIPKDNLLNIMANNQWYMFTYHNGVHQAHPYSSWWFQWIVDARPILYYMDNTVSGFTTRFAAFSNPVVCWTGFFAVVVCGAHAFSKLWCKRLFLGGLGVFAALSVYRVQQTENGIFDPALSQSTRNLNLALLAVCLLLYLLLMLFLTWAAPGHSGKAVFLLVAYLSQLIPWWFIGRTTFEYHYFPSILFLVFAIAYLMDAIVEAGKDWKIPVYGITGLSTGLYVLFYPVLIGLQIPTWYEPIVKWIESWPF
ncbi:MAG: phospholipid carrier-dependent glycosyltransferase, partial [Oscillospiraceae bacterium]|nr:phospholipid carrier-dependent glycosyltransferase [Oscillospiraceae bacterium]